VKVNNNLYPVPRLRMYGAIPLLPLHAFMAMTGKTSFFVLYLTNKKNKHNFARNVYSDYMCGMRFTIKKLLFP
jgi:hypothetical protein